MSLRNICDNAKSASYALMTASVTSTRQDTRAEHDDHHELEATEMDRYQGVNNDDHHSELREDACATAIDEHERYFPTLRKSVKTFWKCQVRATVAHEACRDHFGMHSISSVWHASMPSALSRQFRLF